MTAVLEMPGMEGREAIGQWDWLRVVKRIRLGRRRTGLRTTLLTLATYAKRDGSNVFPSVERLARETEQGRRTVLRHLALLRDVYRLIGRIARGGGRGRRGVTSRYQLTVPEDLLAEFAMLDPDGRPPASPIQVPRGLPPTAGVPCVAALHATGPPGRRLHLVR